MQQGRRKLIRVGKTFKPKIMNSHQEIVKRLIESNAINFDSIGKFVGEAGSSISLSDDPWDKFCGIGLKFLHLYRLSGGINQLPRFENLGNIARTASESQ